MVESVNKKKIIAVIETHLSSTQYSECHGSFHGRSPNSCQVKTFKFFQISNGYNSLRWENSENL